MGTYCKECNEKMQECESGICDLCTVTAERDELKAVVKHFFTKAEDCPLRADDDCEFNDCGSDACIERLKLYARKETP